ncbi:MAG: hypothetical protein IT317_01825 [Anaerolineales bacterium]|nr:hypothetical protein [Anaerolineales bacterium]
MQTSTSSPFQSVIGLGQLKAEYVPRGRGRWVSVIVGLGLVAGGPALTLFGVFMGYVTYQERGMVKVAEAVIPWLVMAVIAFLLGAGILFSAWRSWTLAAALYEQGVALNTRKGIQQAAWADVAAVWQAVTKHYTNGVYTGTTHVYTVQTNAGEKLVFNDSLGKNVEELGRAIQQGVVGALLPRYWQALQNGQRLNFGPLALDKANLYSGKKELPWSQIPSVKIEKGNISIKKEGKGWFNWAAVSVPQVPNFFVFYEIISRLTKVE